MIRARAAVAWAPGEPLDVTEIDVAPPQAGEVLLKVVATGGATPMPTPSREPIPKDFFPRCWAMKAVPSWWRSARA